MNYLKVDFGSGSIRLFPLDFVLFGIEPTASGDEHTYDIEIGIENEFITVCENRNILDTGEFLNNIAKAGRTTNKIYTIEDFIYGTV